MIAVERKSGRIDMKIQGIPMGNDWTVTISGGDAHLGAAALGVSRPSLSDSEKASASVSVLTLTGHKDDILAHRAADHLATALKANILVACGIHFDGITDDELKIIEQMLNEMLHELIYKAKSPDDDTKLYIKEGNLNGCC